MFKKILLCVLLVLLIVAAAVPTVALQGKLDKITVDRSDNDGTASDEDQTEASKTEGHTLTFTEEFFEGLNSLSFYEEDDFCEVVLYVDGQRVDAMPASGSIENVVVAELFVEGGSSSRREIRMNVSDESALRVYSDLDNLFYWSDFYTPVLFLLLDDVTFESIGEFAP